MKRFVAILMLAAASLTSTVLAQSPSPQLNALIDDVDRNFAQMKDFSADFIQYSGVSKTNLNQTRQDVGHLYLAKGHKMRFLYTLPEERQWVSNGKTVYFYDLEERTWSQEPVKESTADMLPLMYLVGQSGLKKNFSFSELTRKPSIEGDRVIRLQLKKKSEDVKEIEIEVDPQRKLIVWMLIVDTNDLRNQFMFSNIRTNSNIQDSFFEFTPPPGTRKVQGVGTK